MVTSTIEQKDVLLLTIEQTHYGKQKTIERASASQHAFGQEKEKHSPTK